MTGHILSLSGQYVGEPSACWHNLFVCCLAARIAFRLRSKCNSFQLEQPPVHDHTALVAGVFAAR